MALFWQNLLKTVFLRQNGFILGNLLKTVVLAKIASVLAKPSPKLCGLGQNGFILAKAAEKQQFWPK